MKVTEFPGDLYLGTSGWSYSDWKDRYYKGLPSRDWLTEYAKHFPAVEVNATFYRAVSPGTFTSWNKTTPEEFAFAIKGSRRITHVQKLSCTPEAVLQEREGCRPLGTKLKAVLWQLPSSLHCDLEKLKAFACLLKEWKDVRHVLEFRHSSWHNQEVASILRHWQLANCQSHSGKWPFWEAVTTDCVYVRLHGSPETYVSAYTSAELTEWAYRICGWLAKKYEVHIYFDNTAHGIAWENARQLLELLTKSN
ncbi:DUF72 domain-containing protein [Candidatus Methylacidithermus pantelleriae]|uniref:DUF72 domain-containing protein n=1 Tax=Candidatus Methylacidithermus pantelleriae TaxID=2744239 RepID=A0A8J2FNH6_9BACT|nr:DUF72 domain-containing protein [Candidatus Methylacidithermus pantelleriae]CAF0692493.1 conserved hypothetical protein [Candidatus Methylacidithermus pantelleriae]